MNGFTKLIGQLRPIWQGVPDETDSDLVDLIRLLRAHLSETYRLHRRILRNRRKSVKFVTPERAGVTLVTVNETQLSSLESLIEAWRIDAATGCSGDSGKVLSQFYWRMLGALLTQPGQLSNLCAERLGVLVKSFGDSFPSETSRLQELALAVHSDAWVLARIAQLTAIVQESLSGRTKLIIFCTDPAVADVVYKSILQRLPRSVVRHTMVSDDESHETSPAFLFNSQEVIRIIVCDRTAEEGLNLQGGSKIVLHFDLPIEPNRIEQRMGRVDRYGAGDPVKSLVLIDEGSKYQRQWFSFVTTSLGVFNRSISSLQYLVESEMQALVASAFAEGLDAMAALADRMGGASGLVATEVKLIDQQDGLDELMPLAEVDLGDIFDVDADWQEIRQAATYWANDTLLFSQVQEPRRANDHLSDPPFRFRYQVPGNGGPATLIALSGFLEDFIGALDFDDPRSSSRQPLSYSHCARRQTGVKIFSRLIRYGDEFVEALKSFSDLDDRGRSYALWRYARTDYLEREPKFFFRFDFLVETNLSEAEVALERFQMRTDTASAAIARRGDALFSPIVERIWVDEEGFEPAADFVERFLELTYDKRGRDPRYIDTNLKSVRLRALMEAAPDAFANWNLRCNRMRDIAKSKLLARASLAASKRTALAKARAEDEIRHAQFGTRIKSLTGREADVERDQLAAERAINEALYRGIDSPNVKIDVVGAVLLSSGPYPLSTIA